MLKKRASLVPIRIARSQVRDPLATRRLLRHTRGLLARASAESTRPSVSNFKRTRRRSTLLASVSSHNTKNQEQATFKLQPTPGLTPSQRRIVVLSWLGIAAMSGYALSLLVFFFTANYSLLDRAAALVWAAAIGHMLLHSIGYANSMLKASRGYNEVRSRVFSPQNSPKVACLVASFNEPPEVLEATLTALQSIR